MKSMILFLFSVYLPVFSFTKEVYNIPYIITDAETIEGEINFSTSVSRPDRDEREFPLKFHYTDEYFSEPSYYYNPSLAALSGVMTVSSYNSLFNYSSENPYLNKSHNIQHFFQQIGISEENYDVSESYKLPPLNNTVGCIVGHKKITVKDEEYTLVVVGIRSGGYETEWVGNVYVGEEGDHVGFGLAKNYVMERVKNHISGLNNPGKIKIWIAGYSRGGATANLVGAELDQDPTLGGTIDCDRDRIYVYCIEPATGANITEEVKNSEQYANIFSFVNPADIVPYVAPTELGFRRYGKDLFLPAPETSASYAQLSERMTELYHSIESSEDDDPLIDSFTMYKIPFLHDRDIKRMSNSIIKPDKNDQSSQAYFLRHLIPACSSLVGTRENYVKNLEKYIMELMYIFMKSPLADIDSAKNQVVNDVIAPAILKAALGKKIDPSEIAEKIAEILNKTLGFAQVVDSVLHLIPFATKLVWYQPNTVATLLYSLSGLGHAHFPEMALAWLMVMDPQYVGADAIAPENCFTQGYYRVLEISGAVDVTASSASANGPEVSIINEIPTAADHFRAPHGIDENDNKFLSFPATQEYTVTITAREDTTLVVNLQAFSPFTGGCVRNIHYDDVTLTANDSLTITIPVISEAEINFNFDAETATKYELKTSSLSTIKPTKELFAKDALNGVITVTATVENEETGFVVGAGEQNYGESVLLRAVPYESYEFKQWVNANGEVISTEEVLRITVTHDIVLGARFTQSKKSQNILLRHPYIFIAAGVGALLVIVTLAILTFCFFRKRCSRKTAEQQEMTEQQAVDYQTFEGSDPQEEYQMA